MTTIPTNPDETSSKTGDKHRLAGRRTELARLDQLLHDAVGGRAAGLQVVGEPGMGKTALLDHAAVRATTYRVLRIRGVASERELPYAGLHMLCAPLLKDIEALPASQREALTTAAGLTAGPPPDRFLVSLATLNLLTTLARKQPVLCIVDDAHWLDCESAQVLGFVARRLQHGAVVILVARREQPSLTELDALAEMHLEPLAWSDAHTLLDERAPGRIDAAVLERMVAEARGVPRALVEELADTAGGLAGGFAIPIPRPGRCEPDHGCVERTRQLPPDARRLLLMAAADPTGDPPLVWRAAARLGIAAGAAERLEAAALVTFGPRVLFTCPRLRSVVYATATHEERRSVHLALGQATDAGADAARAAWHVALATTGLDGAAADRMEQAAPAAYFRGGFAARAAFLEKAALLTADPVRRGERSLAAAEALLDAGAPEAARRMVSIAEMAPPDDARRAAVEFRRAQIGFATQGDGSVARGLLDAAHLLEPHQPALAREGYLGALVATTFSDGLDTGVSGAEVARAARRAAPVYPPRPIDLLLDGLATRLLDGYVEAISPLRRALTAFAQAELDAPTRRWMWLAGFVAAELWDGKAWGQLSARHEELVIDERATESAFAPAQRALAELYHGRFDSARACLDRANRQASWTGASAFPYPALLLDAWQGRAGPSPETLAKTPRQGGQRIPLSAAGLSIAVLHNGAGRYDRSLTAARSAAESDQLGLSGLALIELTEAAVRSGDSDTATRAVERLGRRTRAAGTDWALGVGMAARALLHDGEGAETLYLEAIDRLARSGITVHLARTQLLYGEWLRRRNRRIDARVPLRAARELFAAVGAGGFAERTYRELLATGETVRKRNVETGTQLTPQEVRIAYLARDGLTNPEIAARLVVSARTVEYHLHKVFGKLAISSRTELHLVLPTPPNAERRHALHHRGEDAVDRADAIAS